MWHAFEGSTVDIGAMKVGTGVGLRLNTPIFAIRLDVGFPVPRPENSPVARWYFSLGQAF